MLVSNSQNAGGTTDRESDEKLLGAIELTLVPGLGPVGQAKLWTTCPELAGLWDMTPARLESLGTSPEVSSAIHSRRYRAMAEELLDWALREGCGFLVRGNPGYPGLLEEIYDPPLILYTRGETAALEAPGVAIVGTRRPTVYGLQMAQGLAADLAQRGVTIISGLARGVDAAAHRGCLDAGGRTIAVFGCGIDIIYPREHRHVVQKILKRGLILSEFPPGTSPAPQNFPVRNRVISGLSLGTVIVEASEYSGSLITARLAMEQNRDVFALPGNLTSPQSFGPNFLIKQGAKLVQSWRDVVEELPSEVRHSILSREDAQPVRTSELELLSEEERNLLELLETYTAMQFDRVYLRSGLEIARLSNLLLNLEMRGRIRQLPGNLYVKLARPLK